MCFKYHSYLKTVQNCPPLDYRCRTLRALRFVFKDLNHKNNFLPVLLINPKRRNSFDDSAKCKGYGLSFYDTLENAKSSYLRLKRNHRNIHKTIGTHLAEGRIEESDGLVSEVNRDGHFTLHEFEQTDLKSKFQLVMEVYNHGNY